MNNKQMRSKQLSRSSTSYHVARASFVFLEDVQIATSEANRRADGWESSTCLGADQFQQHPDRLNWNENAAMVRS